MDYQLVESRSALEDYLAGVDGSSLLVIDTEFFRETTYYPQLGLVQLACDGDIACIDPLAFDASAPLAEILLDPAIIKLFHSCSQDMEVLLHYLGDLPCPVYDTQVASALVSDRDQVSYADIVARYCGVELEKSQTRTNWLRRPLSSKQLVYAAEDVHYLGVVFEHLEEELDRRQRRDWFDEDCARLCAGAERYQPDMDRCWTRVKGTRNLGREQLAVIDALARWRECCAMALDITRRQVASDDALVAAAVNRPANITRLTADGRWHRRLQSTDLEAALAAIETAADSDPDSWPRPSRMLQSPEQRKQVKRLMGELERVAGELGIAQSVLGSRKEIDSLVDGSRQLSILEGWRREVIGEHLLSELQ